MHTAHCRWLSCEEYYYICRMEYTIQIGISLVTSLPLPFSTRHPPLPITKSKYRRADVWHAMQPFRKELFPQINRKYSYEIPLLLFAQRPQPENKRI